jgi:hypothetical protein
MWAAAVRGVVRPRRLAVLRKALQFERVTTSSRRDVTQNRIDPGARAAERCRVSGVEPNRVGQHSGAGALGGR